MAVSGAGASGTGGAVGMAMSGLDCVPEGGALSAFAIASAIFGTADSPFFLATGRLVLGGVVCLGGGAGRLADREPIGPTFF